MKFNKKEKIFLVLISFLIIVIIGKYTILNKNDEKHNSYSIKNDKKDLKNTSNNNSSNEKKDDTEDNKKEEITDIQDNNTNENDIDSVNDVNNNMDDKQNSITKKSDKKENKNSNGKIDDNKKNVDSNKETNDNNKNTNSGKENNIQNNENIPSQSSQDITNNQLRNEIKNKYGVSVGYKDEIDGNYVNSYATPTKQYDDAKIYQSLVSINNALNKYPSSFFYEIKNKWKQLTIYLVENINNYAAGLTDNNNYNTVIILINTDGLLFESNLHHEIMHYIDCYLANIVGATELENSMNQLNPDGFAYGNQDNKYVYYFSNPAYFLSSYSKSNYKEDRAVIFADMMFRSLKKDYYTNGNHINEKAKLISRQLDSYFDCVSSSVTETWERFIEW